MKTRIDRKVLDRKLRPTFDGYESFLVENHSRKTALPLNEREGMLTTNKRKDYTTRKKCR